VSYSVPDLSLTGDNAAMIASAAAFRWQKMTETQKKKTFVGWKTLQPDANLKLQ
jgi:tRNA A37 threonylcarbamoyltransferase TsaD